MKIRCHVFVSGLVQGVFFRSTTEEIANLLGLKGWVKNTKDGKVELLIEGEKEKIEEMIKWLHKGPPLARVEKVDIEWQEFKGEFNEFKIRYD